MTATTGDATPSRSAFRSLRVRNYRLYASANLLSNTGTWMQRIGQDWLVLDLSGGSGVALGVVTALQFGPVLVFGMYGGVLADRYPKRRLLLITQAVMGVLALVLGVLVAVGGVELWHVFVLAGALGSVAAIDAPVRQSFVSEMVGPELLVNAVSLNSSTFNGARLFGPALAGLLIGATSGDTSLVFLINAASYGFTIGALAAMRADELHPSPPATGGSGRLRAGLAYTWSRPDLRLAMILILLVGGLGLNSQLTFALMAREEFDLGAEAYGLLGSFFAVGSVTGALVSARRSARPRERFLVVAVVVFGLMGIVSGLMPTYAWFAAMLVPYGAAAMVLIVANNSFVQLGVDPQMRGRVMALYFTCLTGGMPVGGLAVGWVAEHLGAPWAIVLSGALMIATGLGAAVWLVRGRRRGAPQVGAPAPSSTVGAG